MDSSGFSQSGSWLVLPHSNAHFLAAVGLPAVDDLPLLLLLAILPFGVASLTPGKSFNDINSGDNDSKDSVLEPEKA